MFFAKFLVVLLAPALVYSIGLNDAARQTLLDKHNEFRNNINSLVDMDGNTMGEAMGFAQGYARNMCKLKWDQTLAASAQQYADMCDKSHSLPDLPAIWSVRSRYQEFDIGQNLAFINTDDPVTEATWGWMERELAIYRFSDHTCNPNQNVTSCGHLTQALWKETEFIGCGYSKCLRWGSTTDYYGHYVCHYMTAGNLANSDPFVIDDTPGCPNGYSLDSTYPNLCERDSCDYSGPECADQLSNQECYTLMMGSSKSCDQTGDSTAMSWIMEKCPLSCGFCDSPVEPVPVVNAINCAIDCDPNDPDDCDNKLNDFCNKTEGNRYSGCPSSKKCNERKKIRNAIDERKSAIIQAYKANYSDTYSDGGIVPGGVPCVPSV
jgi:hypothetical protein